MSTYTVVNWSGTPANDATQAFRDALAQSGTIFVPELRDANGDILPYPIRNLDLNSGQRILCESSSTTIKGVDPWSTLLRAASGQTPFRRVRIEGGTWTQYGRIVETVDRSCQHLVFNWMAISGSSSFQAQRLPITSVSGTLTLHNYVLGQTSASVGEIVSIEETSGTITAVTVLVSSSSPGFSAGETVNESTTSDSGGSTGNSAVLGTPDALETRDGIAFRFSALLGSSFRDLLFAGPLAIAIQFATGAGGSQSNQNVIDGCYFENLGKHAIASEADALPTVLRVSNCVFQTMPGPAINLPAPTKAVFISSCYFEDCGSSTSRDIELSSQTYVATIEASHFATPDAGQLERVLCSGNAGMVARGNSITLTSASQVFARLSASTKEVVFDRNYINFGGPTPVDYVSALYAQSGNQPVSYTTFPGSGQVYNDVARTVLPNTVSARVIGESLPTAFLEAYLDAIVTGVEYDTATTKVSAWPDAVRKHTGAQTASASQPLYLRSGGPGGGAAIEFDGSSSALDLGANPIFPADDDYSLYVLAKQDDPTDNAVRCVISQYLGSQADRTVPLATQQQFKFVDEGTILLNLGGNDTNWHLFTIVRSGTSVSGYRDGVSVATATAQTILQTGNIVGARSNSSTTYNASPLTAFFNGRIAALVAYRSAHDATTRDHIYRYLSGIHNFSF